MPIKTNQEKATEDTHKRIKKKVKKIKKRIRKNATLTPQVARNTRGDANKYAPYQQFAYRPADSPTHILEIQEEMLTNMHHINNLHTDLQIVLLIY